MGNHGLDSALADSGKFGHLEFAMPGGGEAALVASLDHDSMSGMDRAVR
jgi:hypothetical protein